MSQQRDWWAKIRAGLFRDPSGKHFKYMGSAIWVYGALHMGADLETGEQFRTYKTISRESGIPEPTVRKMMSRLKDYGYIETRRMARGLHIKITKWEPVKGGKRVSSFGLSKEGETDQIFQESDQFRKSECPKMNTSPRLGLSPSHGNNRSKLSTKPRNGRSNKTHKQDPNNEIEKLNFTIEDLNLGQTLRNSILEFKSDYRFKESEEEWAHELGFIRQSRIKDISQILGLWELSRENDFWKKVILTPWDLEKNWDRLEIERDNKPSDGDWDAWAKKGDSEK